MEPRFAEVAAPKWFFAKNVEVVIRTTGVERAQR
jgi:hypothetical protein